MKFDIDTIDEKVQKLGEQISENYINKDLAIISVIPNSLMFSSDLVRSLHLNNITIDCINIRQNKEEAKEKITFTANNSLAHIKNKCVLIVDCVTETGNTIALIQERLLQFNPSSVQSAVLFQKTKTFKGIRPAYVGFEIEDDKFLYGYGLMDKKGLNRNKSFVQALPPKMINEK